MPERSSRSTELSKWLNLAYLTCSRRSMLPVTCNHRDLDSLLLLQLQSNQKSYSFFFSLTPTQFNSTVIPATMNMQAAPTVGGGASSISFLVTTLPSYSENRFRFELNEIRGLSLLDPSRKTFMDIREGEIVWGVAIGEFFESRFGRSENCDLVEVSERIQHRQ